MHVGLFVNNLTQFVGLKELLKHRMQLSSKRGAYKHYFWHI